MSYSRPLLTIAIPTYNRAELLDLALSVLVPQAGLHPDVEVLVSDNCSPDDTPAVVGRYLGQARLRYRRHEVNIGSDANFLSCFDDAAGKYFWLCGDDDVIVAGALDRLMARLHTDEFDLIYATSYGFKRDYLGEAQGDPLNRTFHVVRSTREFVITANAMFTFISGMIINRDRLNEIPHESPREFFGTNLVQLSWVLPLLRIHRRSLILWERVVAVRTGATDGYSVGSIFGTNLRKNALRLLAVQPGIAQTLLNVVVRKALPAILYDLRSEGNQGIQIEDASKHLKMAFGRNLRYWIFLYPVLRLPLPFAKLWLRVGAIINKLFYIIMIPHFWKREIR